MPDDDFDPGAPVPETPMWTMANGQSIPVQEMTDQHVINTIRCFRRLAPTLLERAIDETMSAAASLQGEMATYYAERDCDRLIQTTPDDDFLCEHVPGFAAVLAEAELRGLKP